MTKPPVNAHDNYHAHVYYDASTSEFAKALCTETGKHFNLTVGRFHDRPIGPHPCWSCQIAFGSEDFDSLVPWLDQRRKGLTILIHGLTGDDLADHTQFAYWLGEAQSLKLDMFRGADNQGS